jgi:sulfoxide reductase heme-binding subunit YedZ
VTFCIQAEELKILKVLRSLSGALRSPGWKARHFLVLLTAAGTYAFLESRADWSEMHRWNRAVGDMSLMLISASMALGPLARLWPGAKRGLSFRREFGIHGVVLAIAHTLIILGGWVQWDLIRIFGYELHPVSGTYVMLQHGFALANVIGIVALVYGLVLALSPSNWSQRLLSGSIWKFVQQGAYVLWMLVILHTAYFLYLHFQDFHRPTPEPNWAQIPFAALVALVALLQLAAFTKTWRKKRGSRRRATSVKEDGVEIPVPTA